MPFEWRYSFVPILTNEVLELLEAPGTFMMGCHSVHIKEVEQVSHFVCHQCLFTILEHIVCHRCLFTIQESRRLAIGLYVL